MCACIHLCMSMFMCLYHMQYIALIWECLRTVNMHSNALILVKRSDRTNGKSLLMSGQRSVYITFMRHLHAFTISEVRSLKIVLSPSLHLVAVSCQDFLGHTEGVPFHTAICLTVVIQQGCSGTSKLSDLPTSSGWLGSGKSSNSVCVWVCVVKSESSLNQCLVWLVARSCLCC